MSAPQSDEQDRDVLELEPSPDGPPPVPRTPPGSAVAAAEEDGMEPISVTGHLPARVWPPRTVADLMTRKVITIRQNEPIGDLEAGMARFRFHHLPVVDEKMMLVGIITLTDLLHASLGIGPDGRAIEKADKNTPASAIMRKGVVTGRPDAPATTACRVMLHEKLGCLPIILEDATLVGIVTRTDFIKLALDVLERQN
jgi:CBS domain-containing membrane protein